MWRLIKDEAEDSDDSFTLAASSNDQVGMYRFRLLAQNAGEGDSFSSSSGESSSSDSSSDSGSSNQVKRGKSSKENSSDQKGWCFGGGFN